MLPSSIASSCDQVAEVLDLDLAVGVLVDGERVDDAHRVALAQPLELGDDLAVEVGVVEAQNDQLDGSDCHDHSSLSPGGSCDRVRKSWLHL